jgi:hypothetical protein
MTAVAVEVDAVERAHFHPPVTAVSGFVGPARQGGGERAAVGGDCRTGVCDPQVVLVARDLAQSRRERARRVGREALG